MKGFLGYICKAFIFIVCTISGIILLIVALILLWNVKISGSKEVGHCFTNLYGQTYKNMGSPNWDGESGGGKYKRIREKDECI